MLPKVQTALSDCHSDNAVPLKTLIFESIWQSFADAKKNNTSNHVASPRILDLGVAQSESFRFYSEHNCYLTIADCLEFLTSLTLTEARLTEKTSSALFSKIERFLNLPDVKYDLILCWDSLNYIQPEILAPLSLYLSNFCNNNTLIHGFLLTSESYPKERGQFKIISTNNIEYKVNLNEISQHSPLTPYSINKGMPEFNYSRSVLMRNGLQEFMLNRKQ